MEGVLPFAPVLVLVPQTIAALADNHREAMEAHAESRRALEALIAGMETVIERTAPSRGG